MIGEHPVYVGLATRVIAFVIDAAIINLIATVVTAANALVLSLFHVTKDVRTAIEVVGGVAYILWSIGYFVGFWSATGQTPGSRVMRFRVVPTHGEQIKPRRAVIRLIGLVLAALPLFAGYVLILFDSRRRGLHDRIAGTLVIEAPALSVAKQRRQRRSASGRTSSP